MGRHFVVSVLGGAVILGAAWLYVPVRISGQLGEGVSQRQIDDAVRRFQELLPFDHRPPGWHRYWWLEEREAAEFRALVAREWITREAWWPPQHRWVWEQPQPGWEWQIIGLDLTIQHRINYWAFAVSNLPISLSMVGLWLIWTARWERRRRMAAPTMPA